ncbi:MAG: ATP-binding protein [Candidatus Omnitrophica bacterium]|nr:ATP-binding protein [Candidatus Omnitrophota bacterium]MDD5670334.1 ATP-binding protein [Candidatus Omnitrophota bacterium]
MIISIASGKGGTGKTTLAVNLALSIGNVQLLDCDVEEPNAHLFLKPCIQTRYPAFVTIPKVDEEKCNYCGRCQEVCVFHAIVVLPNAEGKKGSVMIFPNLCHSCGACAQLCPETAMGETKKEIGSIEVGECGHIQFVHGKLYIGEAISPPLIKQVKEYMNPTRTVIIDAPPGTSCPMIASVRGSDFCILVTEPTPFGLNDLVLAVEVVRKMKIPFGVVINRSDIGDQKVEAYCKEQNIPILFSIPFDREIAELYSKGIPLVKAKKEYTQKFIKVMDSITHTEVSR